MTDMDEDAVQSEMRVIAARNAVGLGAAEHLFAALVAGNGSQAQFDHPELGGMGQWSLGGMLMIGDMFNYSLKAKVEALCNDLAGLASRSVVARPLPGDHQAQYQGSGFPPSLEAKAPWWPEELASPAATGAQNDMRYAFFPSSRRLALSMDGKVTVYDTEDHVIGGFSQQQSGDQSVTFSSQHGRIDLSQLAQVPVSGERPT